MRARETKYPESLHPALIAPCGMDCGLCVAHLREKNQCGGCNGSDGSKPKHCVSCRIKHCDELVAAEAGFCYACSRYPCARLRQLDERYRARYGMSMVENLERIRDLGIDGFVATERERWRCAACGGVVCVHRQECIYCGQARNQIVTLAAGDTRRRRESGPTPREKRNASCA